MRAIIVVFCFVFFQAKCQYVITTTGDTLRGEVKPYFMDRLDRVSVNDGTKKKSFTALQVRQIEFGRSVYRPIAYNGTIRFMKLLKSGYLSLYGYRIENQMGYDGRYLVKKDGSALEVPNLAFKRNLDGLLSDDPELVAKINAGTYGRSDLNKIIDEYNDYIQRYTNMKNLEDQNRKKVMTKAETLDAFRKKVEDHAAFGTKQDALDLLGDMKAKVEAGQAIPNYMFETLRGFLAGQSSLPGDVDRLAAAIKQ